MGGGPEAALDDAETTPLAYAWKLDPFDGYVKAAPVNYVTKVYLKNVSSSADVNGDGLTGSETQLDFIIPRHLEPLFHHEPNSKGERIPTDLRDWATGDGSGTVAGFRTSTTLKGESLNSLITTSSQLEAVRAALAALDSAVDAELELRAHPVFIAHNLVKVNEFALGKTTKADGSTDYDGDGEIEPAGTVVEYGCDDCHNNGPFFNDTYSLTEKATTDGTDEVSLNFQANDGVIEARAVYFDKGGNQQSLSFLSSVADSGDADSLAELKTRSVVRYELLGFDDLNMWALNSISNDNAKNSIGVAATISMPPVTDWTLSGQTSSTITTDGANKLYIHLNGDDPAAVKLTIPGVSATDPNVFGGVSNLSMSSYPPWIWATDVSSEEVTVIASGNYADITLPLKSTGRKALKVYVKDVEDLTSSSSVYKFYVSP